MSRAVKERTGSRGTLVGSAEGQRPFARRRLSRREMSEGGRVQARTPCRMPSHQPAGIVRRTVNRQRRLHKRDVRCLPRFLTGVPPAARGYPLDPSGRGTLGLRWHSRVGKDTVRDIPSAPASGTEQPGFLTSTIRRTDHTIRPRSGKPSRCRLRTNPSASEPTR